ncbi:MAG TPA: ATP synthase F0 subunit A [Firmicutes bacterium]|jgi:F-type H+-transporting ATPase subunit a|nr:ATP synthase F0 subunit A [Bacillota bacterium]
MEIEPQFVHWFGLELNLKIVIMTWIVMAIIFVIAWLARRDISWIPKGWQNAMEYLIEFVQGIIKGGIGEHGLKYTYFFSSLFLFIIISNMMGIIPGFSSPTKDINVTAALAVIWVVWLQVVSIQAVGFKNYVKEYFHPFAPFVLINLLDLVTRPLSLAIRLYANIVAGEILLEVLTKNFPILVPDLWQALSIFIGCIQAYLFTILTVSYTGLSVSHEDN